MTLKEAIENAVSAYEAVGIIGKSVSDVKIKMKPITREDLENVDTWTVEFSCNVNLRDD